MKMHPIDTLINGKEMALVYYVFQWFAPNISGFSMGRYTAAFGL